MSPIAPPKALIVAALVPPVHSGAGFSALKYAARLKREGEFAFLLTAAAKPSDDWDLGDENLMEILRKDTVRVGRISENRKRKIGISLLAENFYQFCSTALVIFRRRREFSIVHCFSPTWLSFFASLMAKVIGKRLVVEITLLGGDCPDSVSHNRAPILHERKMIQFRMAHAIVCLSPAIRDVCLRAGFPEKKLALIPRAVDTGHFSPVDLQEKKRIRQKLDLPEDQTLILFVGGILVRKGIDLLLEAFEEIAAERPETALVLVGPVYENADGKFWQSRIKELQQVPLFRDRIFLKGRSQEVSDYMRAADLFVLPSRKEGFPNVLVEAMASGVPAVASALSGTTATIIDPGKNGYIVEKEDAPTLARTILNALERESKEPGVVGKSARLKVIEHFSNEKIDQRYQKLYRRLFRVKDFTISENSAAFPSDISKSINRFEGEL
ncbi:MAG TPA: glycosyltransferase [Opitutales bacterium]|nr:glycosyltransferase [Opitutales bacterium]